MNKALYEKFCQENYVTIFSQPWWMDAVVGPDNWDVWIYEKGGKIWAAMPYYIEEYLGYRKISKAPLTQNNGIIISYPEGQKIDKRQAWEEEITEAAIEHIESLCLDSFQAQLSYDYSNFLTFFWNYYTVTPRYTYVIEDLSDLKQVQDNISSNYRKNIHKGLQNTYEFKSISEDVFWREHEKVFLRQGIGCPFDYELWKRLYAACIKNNAGYILSAQNETGKILSLIFMIEDARSAYLLLGGSIPDFSSLQTYSALIYKCIELTASKGLKFDFEGSIIRRINHSYREFGGTPKLYYRITKLFNEELIMKEAKEKIERLRGGYCLSRFLLCGEVLAA